MAVEKILKEKSQKLSEVALKVIFWLMIPLLILFLLPFVSNAANSPAQTEALAGMIVPQASFRNMADNSVVSRSGEQSGDYQIIYKTAMSLLGRKYRYGSDGPDLFDCSGFTEYVFKFAGINLPHSAAGQAQCGMVVEKQDLVPGDLVFFSYYEEKGIKHVGIYIGNGEFIHASSSKNVVMTSALDSQYYAENYICARRLFK